MNLDFTYTHYLFILDEAIKPNPISQDEQLIRNATKNIQSNKRNEDEEAKAKLAIDKILEEANLRDKPGFDDPTKDLGSVTTYK